MKLGHLITMDDLVKTGVMNHGIWENTVSREERFASSLWEIAFRYSQITRSRVKNEFYWYLRVVENNKEFTLHTIRINGTRNIDIKRGDLHGIKVDDPALPKFFRWKPLSLKRVSKLIQNVGNFSYAALPIGWNNDTMKKLGHVLGAYRILTDKERMRSKLAHDKIQQKSISRKRKRMD